ncbi:hypothetical protein [Planotetraspora kaengkrachanensis]|uniref:Uncharacterized protein n=1 Tax=Planotetraspora kaengkrachanensis TaxID=575193 RepID=A0A8J3LYZ5_9ACTN|nr:hypothetical protein [Planotetraspora kaengkrachanensis]GIG80504.1 hypothetical protein Pka01_36310 [Planotetraspora kaengkrachanensis]
MGELLGAMISLAALTVLVVLALLAISAAVLVALGALAATTRREPYMGDPVAVGRRPAGGGVEAGPVRPDGMDVPESADGMRAPGHDGLRPAERDGARAPGSPDDRPRR